MTWQEKLTTKGIFDYKYVSDNIYDDAINFFVFWYTRGTINFNDLPNDKKAHMRMVAKSLSNGDLGEMIAANLLKEDFELLFANIVNKTSEKHNSTGVDLFVKKDDIYYFVEIKNVVVDSVQNINTNIGKVISEVKNRMNNLDVHLTPLNIPDFFDEKGNLIKDYIKRISGIGIVIKADFNHSSRSEPDFGVGVVDVKRKDMEAQKMCIQKSKVEQWKL